MKYFWNNYIFFLANFREFGYVHNSGVKTLYICFKRSIPCKYITTLLREISVSSNKLILRVFHKTLFPLREKDATGKREKTYSTPSKTKLLVSLAQLYRIEEKIKHHASSFSSLNFPPGFFLHILQTNTSTCQRLYFSFWIPCSYAY